MLTRFVLASITVGGLTVMSAPLAFQGLLDLRYPPLRKGASCEREILSIAGAGGPEWGMNR
ncbi:hypothetical protein [Methylobacterium sp. ID0610]|uniref:hypothetical protein n=1 Tax=Methylobacterium carpenticola TaxID=3344827 RepID=UPI00369A85EF